jgi:hypothetical protein
MGAGRNALLLELENSGEAELFLCAGSVVWGQKLTIMQRPIMIAAKAFHFSPLLTRAKSEWYIGPIFYTSIHDFKINVLGYLT